MAKKNKNVAKSETQVPATNPTSEGTPASPATTKADKAAHKEQQLTELAQKIRTGHGQVLGLLKKTAVIARELGQNLIEAKKLVKSGRWGSWLDEHCHLTDRQAQKYMRLARRWDDLAAVEGYDPATASIEDNLALLASLDGALLPNGRPAKKGSPAADAELPLRVASEDDLEHKQELAKELVEDNHLDFSKDSPADNLVNSIVSYAVQQVSKRVPKLKAEGTEGEAFDAVAVLDKIRSKLKAKAVIEIAAEEPVAEAEEPAPPVVPHNRLNGMVPVSVPA